MNSTTATAGAVLHNRYAALIPPTNTKNATSIETIEGEATNNTSIELPPEITALITGTPFWVQAKTNRYKKLAREGHLTKLLHLAREAQDKEHPDHWFAAACSKARWEKYTLPYFAKLADVARKAADVARRLCTKINRFIYKQIWRGVNVERWAIAAQEMRHDRPGQSREKYFAWLCVHERELAR